MKKWVFGVIGGVLLIAIIVGFLLFRNTTTPALLYIDKQKVEVDSGRGYQPAVDEMVLKEDYKVKTLDGVANIVFYDSEILQLEPGTEIMISDLSKDVKLKQQSGSTWSRVLKLTGVNSYSVQTPSSVVTVRGTGFAINLEGNETVVVGEGTVTYVSGGTTIIIDEFLKGILVNGTPELSQLTEEEKAMIQDKLGKDISILQRVRQKVIESEPLTYSAVKASAGLTDEDVKNYLSDVDQGKYDPDDLESKSPLKTPTVRALTILSKKIIELKKELNNTQN